jgi:hypothetical protein
MKSTTIEPRRLVSREAATSSTHHNKNGKHQCRLLLHSCESSAFRSQIVHDRAGSVLRVLNNLHATGAVLDTKYAVRRERVEGQPPSFERKTRRSCDTATAASGHSNSLCTSLLNSNVLNREFQQSTIDWIQKKKHYDLCDRAGHT